MEASPENTTVIDCLRAAHINSSWNLSGCSDSETHSQHALLRFSQCWPVCAPLSLDLKLLLSLPIYSGKTVGTLSIDFFQNTLLSCGGFLPWQVLFIFNRARHKVLMEFKLKYNWKDNDSLHQLSVLLPLWVHDPLKLIPKTIYLHS